MAATVGERKLLVAGEWVETGEWREVELALLRRGGRTRRRRRRRAHPQGGRRRRRVRCASRSPRTSARESSSASPLLLADRQEEAAQTISAEAGKPMKAARVEAPRAVSTYETAAAVARRATGETIPMDASPAGAGKVAFTMRVPIGVVGAISPFNFPHEPRRAQDRARPGRRLLRRAEARGPDAALGALPRRARDRGRPAAGLAQRPRRQGVRHRRRPRGGRAREDDHVHRLERRRLGAPRSAPRRRRSRSSSATRRR